MNSIGTAGRDLDLAHDLAGVDRVGRVGRLVAAHAVGLVGRLALQAPLRNASSSTPLTARTTANHSSCAVGVEDERLGDAADRAHDAVHEPAVGDVAAVAGVERARAPDLQAAAERGSAGG